MTGAGHRVLAAARAVHVMDWPSRDVPETLARAGFDVVVHGGPTPETTGSYRVENGEVSRLSRTAGGSLGSCSPLAPGSDPGDYESMRRYLSVGASFLNGTPKTHARPVRAGRRLVVWPDWIDPGGLDDGLVRPGDVVVRIDPGRAFGSGSHPSTRLCLGVLDDLVDPASSVLDVGCGSGVLAVAAALLGADPVVAVDVDPVAVAATRDNAAANGMTGRVVASTTPVGEITGTSSVVVANIGAATLVELAGDIVARLAPGGTLVLAGLLTSSWDRVRVAYEAHDLMLVAVPEEEGWVAPVFTNPRRA